MKIEKIMGTGVVNVLIRKRYGYKREQVSNVCFSYGRFMIKS
jgi:hypothetical protein